MAIEYMRVEEVGLEPMLSALSNIADAPDRAKAALDEVLGMAFEDTQAKTHVITGSLKASGKMEVSVDGDEWKGTITYGGASGGPINPVNYAIYEMARGGAHDFFGDFPVYEELMEQAVAEVIEASE